MGFVSFYKIAQKAKLDERNKMKNLKIVNVEQNNECGFFFVEFGSGKSVQCCLKANPLEGGEFNGYANQIEVDNNGFGEGLSLECNEWAINKYGEEEVHEFLIEQARKAGIQIVA